MIVTTALLFLFLFVLFSWWFMLKDFKRHKIRGPLPLPIVGNGHLFLGNSAEFLKALQKLSDEYKNVVLIYILSKRFVLITNPKYAEGIMSGTETILKGRSYKYLEPWLGQGLLTSSGLKWKQHRKFLTPAFHYNILQTFFPTMLSNTSILIKKLDRLADGQPVNMFPIIALAALDIITESIMGTSVNAQKNSESSYVKAIEEECEIVARRMRNLLISPDVLFNLSSYKRSQDKALDILHGHTNNVIEARRQELKKNNITELNYDCDYGLKNRHAFLDLLLLAEMDNRKIDDESIREQVDTFMFEGHDTTTSGISFCLYCISLHEDVQEKLIQEQRSIFGDNMKRDPTYNELHQMKYLELVIKESLRLYPSVPLFERLIAKDMNISGLELFADTAVLINVFGMQRNPEVFEDPLEFRPERFDSNLKNPFSWLAFSAGPRNCIGQKFAMMEMKIVVSSIVKHFRILPAGPEPILSADLILKSLNGVHVALLPRP